MITRRAVLTLAAAAFIAAAAPHPTQTPDFTCCQFDYDLDLHALDCPDCLAQTCPDCQAEPGQECDFGCSSYWR